MAGAVARRVPGGVSDGFTGSSAGEYLGTGADERGEKAALEYSGRNSGKPKNSGKPWRTVFI